MNLFLRLLRIFFLAQRKAGTSHYNDTHSLTFQVFLTDQDVFNHLNNSRYLSMTDLAMVDWLIRIGAWRAIRKKNWFPVFVYKELFFIKQLQFPQKFNVHTKLTGWDGSYVCLEHRFMRGDVLYAISRSIGRVIGRKGQRPTVTELIAVCGFDPANRPTLPNEFQERLENFNALKAPNPSSG